MKEKIIEINILPEYKDFLRTSFWWQMKKLWYIYLFFLFTIGGTIFLSVKTNSHLDISFIIPFVLIFLLIASNFITAKKAIQGIKGKSHYIFSEGGVDFESYDVKSHIGWSNYVEVWETKKDFLMSDRKSVV